MKTLYVSDLDGTLLNSNTALTDTTIETINALVEEGMEFTFATARSITSASLVSRGLHLRTPLIVMGSICWIRILMISCIRIPLPDRMHRIF